MMRNQPEQQQIGTAWSGKGITDESSTATENKPSEPKCVSQCGMSEWWTGRAFNGAACRKAMLTNRWTLIFAPRWRPWNSC